MKMNENESKKYVTIIEDLNYGIDERDLMKKKEQRDDLLKISTVSDNEKNKGDQP